MGILPFTPLYTLVSEDMFLYFGLAKNIQLPIHSHYVTRVNRSPILPSDWNIRAMSKGPATGSEGGSRAWQEALVTWQVVVFGKASSICKNQNL